MWDNVFGGGNMNISHQHAYLKRDRIHNLLEESMQKLMVTVVAGAGYGKTQAVHMFLREYGASTFWMQLTTLDNLGVHFWENTLNTIAAGNKKLACQLEMLGYPETQAKYDMFLSYIFEALDPQKKYVVVYDDFHLLHEKKSLHFIEKFINAELPNFTSVIISRTEPEINMAGLLTKEKATIITETDLCFNEAEMVNYYELQGISISPQLLSRIYNNTDGWIMAIRLIELSIKKGVKREEYAISAMKSNIYKLIDSEIYSYLSQETLVFLAKLALFDSWPQELVAVLSAGNRQLIDAMAQINSFIRFDSFANMYYIHHLFLEFLREKGDILTPYEKKACYQEAADWHAANGYTIDAINNYGKAGDYEGLLKVALFWPHATAEEGALVLDIMSKAPDEVFNDPMIALLRVRALWFIGKSEDFMAETQRIIETCEALPKTPENLSALAELYLSTGLSYYYLANTTNDFHFADYVIKAAQLVKDKNIAMRINYSFQDVGTYVCRISSETKDDMDAYLEAVKTISYFAPKMMPGCMCGMDDLTLAELYYLQGCLKEAEKAARQALHKAREHNQHSIAMRAIFYLLRASLASGNYAKINDCLKHLDIQLKTENSPLYKTLCDISTSWFYSIIGQADNVSAWVKNIYEPANLNLVASGMENLAKIKYGLCEKKYPELLAFLEIQEGNSDINSFLFGQVLLASSKAVCLYHMDKKVEAMAALREAYSLSAPNGLIMHFVELGNSMVAMAKYALKNGGCGMAEDWLQNVLKKSSTFAKRISQVTTEYKKANKLDAETPIKLTKKELELLTDVFQGLSRAEIAVSYGLSPNYVKNRLKAICDKLGAKNTHDAIRIALQQRLIK